ncbi:hypothetical protein, partial [Achromobacter sp. UMC71]|uniref:hypothetical protein n=1 Tax=Achromobacter sp. UMC71 TaxID=1862320 RepID=UPI001C7E96A6
SLSLQQRNEIMKKFLSLVKSASFRLKTFVFQLNLPPCLATPSGLALAAIEISGLTLSFRQLPSLKL